jgi:hypothetical protein
MTLHQTHRVIKISVFMASEGSISYLAIGRIDAKYISDVPE